MTNICLYRDFYLPLQDKVKIDKTIYGKKNKETEENPHTP